MTGRSYPWANEQLGYLTTTGRKSGQPHTIEIWFAEHDGRLYLLSGGRMRADWIQNLHLNPAVGFRVAGQEFRGHAELVNDPAEDALARRLLATKYQSWREGEPLSDWAQTATPVRIVLTGS